jgi:hypothetical protein
MHMSQGLFLSENCSSCFGFHYHPSSRTQNNCNYSYYDAWTHQLQKKRFILLVLTTQIMIVIFKCVVQIKVGEKGVL